jgi:signal transduction histidine kinase
MESPIPDHEFNRLLQLLDYDTDSSSLESNLKDLTKLAAKVAGTSISLVNLIDSYTQWSVAAEGLSIVQMPREDSVCQYTIMGDQPFEVKNLKEDERFMEKFYVTNSLNLSYYFGIPLKNDAGYNLGALCVMDSETKDLSPEKVELLEIIADVIIKRLKLLKSISLLNQEVKHAKDKQRQVAHDIRGPIGGIIGLAHIIKEQGDKNKLDDVLEFITIIHDSGKSILELADEILTECDQERKKTTFNPDNEYNLLALKEKIQLLYGIQGEQKMVTLFVELIGQNVDVPFPKSKVLQLLGNLISNAIKFTPSGGKVTVTLGLTEKAFRNELFAEVIDNGAGMTESQVEEILKGEGKTTKGTSGEKGFGFGLPIVKQLVDGMGGSFRMDSKLGEYSRFEVRLPL